jgi:hypothetical protein
VTAVISRNGDLLGDMWLESVMTRGTGSTFYPAEQLCKTITVELGGQQLDKLYSTWYRIYDNLYRNVDSERAAYKEMTDFVDGEIDGTTKRFFTPILFWFCKSPGNYLPLIALINCSAQKHRARFTKALNLGKPLGRPFLIDASDASRFVNRRHFQIAGTP